MVTQSKLDKAVPASLRRHATSLRSFQHLINVQTIRLSPRRGLAQMLLAQINERKTHAEATSKKTNDEADNYGGVTFLPPRWNKRPNVPEKRRPWQARAITSTVSGRALGDDPHKDSRTAGKGWRPLLTTAPVTDPTLPDRFPLFADARNLSLARALRSSLPRACFAFSVPRPEGWRCAITAASL